MPYPNLGTPIAKSDLFLQPSEAVYPALFFLIAWPMRDGLASDLLTSPNPKRYVSAAPVRPQPKELPHVP